MSRTRSASTTSKSKSTTYPRMPVSNILGLMCTTNDSDDSSDSDDDSLPDASGFGMSDDEILEGSVAVMACASMAFVSTAAVAAVAIHSNIQSQSQGQGQGQGQGQTSSSRRQTTSSSSAVKSEAPVKSKSRSKRTRKEAGADDASSSKRQLRRSKRLKVASSSGSAVDDDDDAILDSSAHGTSSHKEDGEGNGTATAAVPKSMSMITPSPLVRNGPHSKAKIYMESSGNASISTLGIDIDVGSSSNDSGSDCQRSLGKNELPKGVYSIQCPHLTKTKGNGSDNSSCSCCFKFDDCATSSQNEKFIASYLPEYIRSLQETEFNLEHVSESKFPAHLQKINTDDDDSSSSGSDSSSAGGSSVPCSVSASSQTRRRSPRLAQKEAEVKVKEEEEDSDSSSISSSSAPSSKDESYASQFSSSSTFHASTKKKVESMGLSLSNSPSLNLPASRYSHHMDYMVRNKNAVTENMRAVLVDWLIEVSEEYKLQSITLHTAVALVDRCLASCVIVKDVLLYKYEHYDDYFGEDIGKNPRPLVVDKGTIQLLGCGCMLIASKMHEVNPPVVKDYIYISAETYKAHQIVDMEVDICNLLQFNLHITTPLHFAKIYLRASYVSGGVAGRMACSMPQDDVMAMLVEYFLELALLDYRMVSEEPSNIAAAAVYLARATLDVKDISNPEDIEKENYFSKTLEWYCQRSAADMEDAVLFLHQAHTEASDNSLKAVFEKWTKSDLKKVAYKQPISDEEIDKLFD